jgi:hypothetical protein
VSVIRTPGTDSAELMNAVMPLVDAAVTTGAERPYDGARVMAFNLFGQGVAYWTLIWNQRHLLRVLREFEQFYNSHRPHQGIANARPLRALPSPIPEPTAVTRLHIHRRDRLGGILHEHRHAA